MTGDGRAADVWQAWNFASGSARRSPSERAQAEQAGRDRRERSRERQAITAAMAARRRSALGDHRAIATAVDAAQAADDLARLAVDGYRAGDPWLPVACLAAAELRGKSVLARVEDALLQAAEAGEGDE